MSVNTNVEMNVRIKKYIISVLIFATLIFVGTPGSTKAAVFGVNNFSLYQQMTELLQKMNALLVGQAISATTINVTTTEGLFTALSTAVGGETIYLAPGDYSINLSSQAHPFVAFPREVVITSKDPNNKAAIIDMSLGGVQNLTFDTLIFDYRFKSGNPDWLRPFTITNSNGQSKNITIRNSIFDGDEASGTGNSSRDGFGTGFGIGIDGRGTLPVDGILIENNEFRKWLRAGIFGDTNNLIVRGNDVSDIRSDGFDFASIQYVTIEGNYFHDFRQSSNSGDHMDMIQFWTTGTDRPNTNIIIRNNWLLAEAGDWTQSIFMRNEKVDTKQAGSEMFYRNVTIENNVIHNAHLHGITLGESDGVVIRNNTLLHNKDAGDEGTVNIPNINISAAAINVSVTKNILPIIKPKAEPANFSDNLYVQQSDSAQPNYYNDYFMNALAQGDASKKDFLVIPGSLVNTGNYGSALIQPPAGTAYFTALPGKGFNLQTYLFSAKGDGVTAATWNFGNGKSGSGLEVSHTYDKPGLYTVTQVATQGGKKITTKRTIKVESPLAFKADFSSGLNDSSVWALKGSGTGGLRTSDGFLSYTSSGIQNVSYGYPRPHLLNNKQYTLAFDARFPTSAKVGATIYYSLSFIINLSPTAGVFNIMNDGVSKVMNIPLNLSLNTWHRVVLVFDGDKTSVKVYINGVLVGEQSGLGTVQKGSVFHSLVLGDQWSATAPYDLDNVLFFKAAMTDAQVAAYVANGSLPVGDPVVVQAAGKTPVIKMSANPTTAVEGSGTTLTWTSTDATSCTASGDWTGTKTTNGSETITPLKGVGTKTFVLTCAGSGGTASEKVAVSVTAASIIPTPTLALSVSPSTVVTGGSATLTWNSSDVSNCTASGDWAGTKVTNGSQSTGALTAGLKTYTLICNKLSPNGVNLESITKTATVRVSDTAVPVPAPIPAPISQFKNGDRITVVSNVNVRSSGLISRDTLLGVNPQGSGGVLVGGPTVSTDRFGTITWFKVDFDSGFDGWVGADNFKLSTGSAVSATTNALRVQTISNLNVRSTPNGTKIGTQPLGAQGTMSTTTQTTAGGYEWAYVDFDSSPDGYTVKTYLKDLTANTTSQLEATLKYLQSELARLQKLLKSLQPTR